MPMQESVHVKVVFRAAQIKGGAGALAQALGVSLQEVQSWMRGEMPIPERVYLELLDAITEDVLREISGGSARSGNGGNRSPGP
jgi:DNA-binding transcriptional regulator YdaS (Cro superfamily)